LELQYQTNLVFLKGCHVVFATLTTLFYFSISFLVAINHDFPGLWRKFLNSRCQHYARNFLENYIFLMTATWLGCYLFSSSFAISFLVILVTISIKRK
jgi:hypothetical protein